MPYLKFYQKERKLFPEEAIMRVSDKRAEIIFRKLERHFIDSRRYPFGLRFYGNGGGSCGSWGIRLPHNPTILFICHELSHRIHQIKYGSTKRHHTKKLMTIIKRLITYCQKKNYWKEEIERRMTPKPEPLPKLEPTKLQIMEAKLGKETLAVKRMKERIKATQRKMENQEERLKKHERLVGYYEKLFQERVLDSRNSSTFQ